MAQRGRATRGKQHQTDCHSPPIDPPTSKSKRIITQGLAVLALGVLVVAIVVSNPTGTPIAGRPPVEDDSLIAKVDFKGDRTTWQLLALPDEELEKVSLVELNLAVVREIPGYEDLDLAKYETIVDQWAHEFAKELPEIDATFIGHEAEFKNDLRFYRIGQLMAWLGHEKHIEYIPEQKGLKTVRYKDPAELFLHGLLDTRMGTCGNMPALQAAIARRLGWPVALAPVETHTVCRYDDGEVAYNIETTHTDKGGFSEGGQEDYAREFNLPPCAFSEARTLETMSAREMLGYFIALRGRYYWDTSQWEKADQDHSLARALLPRHRATLLMATELALLRSEQIFSPDEVEHPMRMVYDLNQQYEAEQWRQQQVHAAFTRQAQARQREWQERQQSQFARIQAINEHNRRLLENPNGYQQPQPQPYDPFAPFPQQQPPY